MSEVERWEAKIRENGPRFIPDYMIDGLVLYVCHGVPMGSFGSALLKNDLRGALEKGDENNQRAIAGWVKLLYNYAPSGCWGSVERVNKWIESGGLAGQFKAAAAE